MLEQKRSRPAGNRAAGVEEGGSTTQSLPIPEFAAMSARGQHVAMEYWRSGYQYGWAAGFAAAEAEQAELDRRAAAAVSTAVKHPPFDRLCELRGEPERAEQQRRTLAERGIC